MERVSQNIKLSKGKLTLKIIKAQLFKNTEMFGKMDPWVKMTYRPYNQNI